MAHGHLEEELAQLHRRLNRVESLVDHHHPPVHAKSETWKGFWGSINKSDIVQIIGWAVVSASVLAMIVYYAVNQALSPVLAIWLVIGLWMAGRTSQLFGLSDSTVVLLQEERASKKLKSATAHQPPDVREFGRKPFDAKDHPVESLFLAAIIFILALIYSWLVFHTILDPAWQALAFMGIVLLGLVYSMLANRLALTYLSVVVMYLLFANTQAPLFSILALMLVSIGLLYYSWQRKDWGLLLLTVLATHLVLFRWAFHYSDALYSDARVVEGVMAEVLLLLSLVFTIPFINRRREAGEREIVRGILIINAVGFTLLTAWLTDRLMPQNWELSYAVTLLIFVSFAAVAWLSHGRYSYAKYYALAALIAVLVGAALYFPPVMVTLIWFMLGVAVLTSGFLMESYTGRLTGLFILGGAFFHYMFGLLLDYSNLTTDNIFLSTRFWLGILLGSFLWVVAEWFKQLKSRGEEEKYRPATILMLQLGSGLTLLGLLVSEVVSNVHL